MRLYCATTNPGKLREFRKFFAGSVISLEPLQIPAPEETGASFEENAVAKAIYYSTHADALVFAEDSGLEVDALGGQPGVYSARYAGPGASDDDNNRLLVERMRGVKDRAARFVAVIALARAGQLIGTFHGSVEGELLDAPCGQNGFGYDPLFYYSPFGCTFGEARLEAKLSVSHRTKALRGMQGVLLK